MLSINQFSVGNALGRSFSIWLQNIIPFTLLNILIHSPIILYTLSVTSGDMTLKSIQTWNLVVVLGNLSLGFIATAAMIYGVFQQLRGRHAGLGACLSAGLSRLFPVLGVGILVGICVVLGMLALVIPGVILAMMLYVAVPVAVVERPGVFASLKRSSELTKGYKGHIFIILLVIGGLERLISYIAEQSMIGNSPTMSDVKAYLFVVLAISIVLGTLGAVVNAVVYHDLRATKDGVDIEELVRVFE